jgi:holo-[acyl-carrier protein] synthase
MISGVGVDIENIRRFERLAAKHRSLSHIYGPAELALLASCGARSYAANYCAKEAFAKALGTGVRGFRLREVELLRDSGGRPYYSLSGAAKLIAQSRGLVFHVSVTHSDEYAAAFAVAEGDEQN